MDNVNKFNNNNRTLLVGRSFSGETYVLLKLLSRFPDRDVQIIIKSPPKQYSNSRIEIEDIGEEIKHL